MILIELCELELKDILRKLDSIFRRVNRIQQRESKNLQSPNSLATISACGHVVEAIRATGRAYDSLGNYGGNGVRRRLQQRKVHGK